MALDPCEFKNYVKIIRQTENMLGSGENALKRRTRNEENF